MSNNSGSSNTRGMANDAAIGAAAYGIGHEMIENTHFEDDPPISVPPIVTGPPYPSRNDRIKKMPGGHSVVTPQAAAPSHNQGLMAQMYQSPGPGSFEYHQKYHGPFSWLIDFVRDPDGVAQFEEYSEKAGICKYCFEPGTTALEAPRTHHPWPQGNEVDDYRQDPQINQYGRYMSPADKRSPRRSDSNMKYIPAYDSRLAATKNERVASEKRRNSPSVRHEQPLQSVADQGVTECSDISRPTVGYDIDDIDPLGYSSSQSKGRSRERPSTRGVGGSSVPATGNSLARNKGHSSKHKRAQCAGSSPSFSSSSSASGSVDVPSKRHVFSFFSKPNGKKQRRSNTRVSKGGLFEFGNGSSSSDPDLVFGNGRFPPQKQARDKKRKSVNSELAGISATAAALAASVPRRESRRSRDSKYVQNPNLIYGHTNPHNSYAQADRDDDDEWEFESEAGGQISSESYDSGLAYGGESPSGSSSSHQDLAYGDSPTESVSHHDLAYGGSSTESVSSAQSGGWWPWSGRGKNSQISPYSRPTTSVSRTHSYYSPDIAASGAYEDVSAASETLEPMQDVVPVPTTDPHRYDVRHAGSVAAIDAGGLMSQRRPVVSTNVPDVLKEPQPIAPVPQTLYTTQGEAYPYQSSTVTSGPPFSTSCSQSQSNTCPEKRTDQKGKDLRGSTGEFGIGSLADNYIYTPKRRASSPVLPSQISMGHGRRQSSKGVTFDLAHEEEQEHKRWKQERQMRRDRGRNERRYLSESSPEPDEDHATHSDFPETSKKGKGPVYSDSMAVNPSAGQLGEEVHGSSSKWIAPALIGTSTTPASVVAFYELERNQAENKRKQEEAEKQKIDRPEGVREEEIEPPPPYTSHISFPEFQSPANVNIPPQPLSPPSAHDHPTPCYDECTPPTSALILRPHEGILDPSTKQVSSKLDLPASHPEQQRSSISTPASLHERKQQNFTPAEPISPTIPPAYNDPEHQEFPTIVSLQHKPEAAEPPSEPVTPEALEPHKINEGNDTSYLRSHDVEAAAPDVAAGASTASWVNHERIKAHIGETAAGNIHHQSYADFAPEEIRHTDIDSHSGDSLALPLPNNSKPAVFDHRTAGIAEHGDSKEKKRKQSWIPDLYLVKPTPPGSRSTSIGPDESRTRKLENDTDAESVNSFDSFDIPGSDTRTILPEPIALGSGLPFMESSNTLEPMYSLAAESSPTDISETERPVPDALVKAPPETNINQKIISEPIPARPTPVKESFSPDQSHSQSRRVSSPRDDNGNQHARPSFDEDAHFLAAAAAGAEVAGFDPRIVIDNDKRYRRGSGSETEERAPEITFKGEISGRWSSQGSSSDESPLKGTDLKSAQEIKTRSQETEREKLRQTFASGNSSGSISKSTPAPEKITAIPQSKLSEGQHTPSEPLILLPESKEEAPAKLTKKQRKKMKQAERKESVKESDRTRPKPAPESQSMAVTECPHESGSVEVLSPREYSFQGTEPALSVDEKASVSYPELEESRLRHTRDDSRHMPGAFENRSPEEAESLRETDSPLQDNPISVAEAASFTDTNDNPLMFPTDDDLTYGRKKQARQGIKGKEEQLSPLLPTEGDVSIDVNPSIDPATIGEGIATSEAVYHNETDHNRLRRKASNNMHEQKNQNEHEIKSERNREREPLSRSMSPKVIPDDVKDVGIGEFPVGVWDTEPERKKSLELMKENNNEIEPDSERGRDHDALAPQEGLESIEHKERDKVVGSFPEDEWPASPQKDGVQREDHEEPISQNHAKFNLESEEEQEHKHRRDLSSETVEPKERVGDFPEDTYADENSLAVVRLTPRHHEKRHKRLSSRHGSNMSTEHEDGNASVAPPATTTSGYERRHRHQASRHDSDVDLFLDDDNASVAASTSSRPEKRHKHHHLRHSSPESDHDSRRSRRSQGDVVSIRSGSIKSDEQKPRRGLSGLLSLFGGITKPEGKDENKSKENVRHHRHSDHHSDRSHADSPERRHRHLSKSRHDDESEYRKERRHRRHSSGTRSDVRQSSEGRHPHRHSSRARSDIDSLYGEFSERNHHRHRSRAPSDVGSLIGGSTVERPHRRHSSRARSDGSVLYNYPVEVRHHRSHSSRARSDVLGAESSEREGRALHHYNRPGSGHSRHGSDLDGHDRQAQEGIEPSWEDRHKQKDEEQDRDDEDSRREERRRRKDRYERISDSGRSKVRH